MTNIDFTNEESVNYILNYSQMLINEMAKTKRIAIKQNKL